MKSFEFLSYNYKFLNPIVDSNSTFYSMTYNSSAYWSNKNEYLYSITPISLNFIGQLSPMDAPIQELAKIKVIGTFKWFIYDSRGTTTSIETTLLTIFLKQIFGYSVHKLIYVKTSLVQFLLILVAQI